MSINNVLKNGLALSAQETGQSQSLSGTGVGANVSSGLKSANVTASGVKPVGTGTESGTGFNLFGGSENLKTILGGIETLGSLWNSFQQHKIAREQLALQRQAFTTNLANNTQTYNTALEDRIRARHFTEGRAANETSAYLQEHRL